MTATEQLYHMNAIYQAQRERIAAEWDKLSVNTTQTRLHQLGETRREDAISYLAKLAMREVLAAETLPACPVCGKSEEHSSGCRNDPRQSKPIRLF